MAFSFYLAYNNSVADEVGPLFFLEGGETMSDFEILSIVERPNLVGYTIIIMRTNMRYNKH